MTREQLIALIRKCDAEWSCDMSCEGKEQHDCMACATKLVDDYEKAVKNELIDQIIKVLSSRLENSDFDFALYKLGIQQAIEIADLFK